MFSLLCVSDQTKKTTTLFHFCIITVQEKTKRKAQRFQNQGQDHLKVILLVWSRSSKGQIRSQDSWCISEPCL